MPSVLIVKSALIILRKTLAIYYPLLLLSKDADLVSVSELINHCLPLVFKIDWLICLPTLVSALSVREQRSLVVWLLSGCTFLALSLDKTLQGVHVLYVANLAGARGHDATFS